MSLEFENAEGRLQHELPTHETPEKLFDRRWAVTLLDRVVLRLRDELARVDKRRQFDELKLYLTGDVAPGTYARAGRRWTCPKEPCGLPSTVCGVGCGDLLRDEIADTVSSPEEVEDEIRHLWAAVAR